MQSFKDCISMLVKKYSRNTERWTWGKIHTIAFIHPLGSVKLLGALYKLNSEVFPIGGSDHAVCPTFHLSRDFQLPREHQSETFITLPTGMIHIPFFREAFRVYPGTNFTFHRLKLILMAGSTEIILAAMP